MITKSFSLTFITLSRLSFKMSMPWNTATSSSLCLKCSLSTSYRFFSGSSPPYCLCPPAARDLNKKILSMPQSKHFYFLLKSHTACYLTLFIMRELIINSKLATAGPGHFELQKYTPKRKLYQKNCCFNQDSSLGPIKS